MFIKQGDGVPVRLCKTFRAAMYSGDGKLHMIYRNSFPPDSAKLANANGISSLFQEALFCSSRSSSRPLAPKRALNLDALKASMHTKRMFPLLPIVLFDKARVMSSAFSHNLFLSVLYPRKIYTFIENQVEHF